MSTPVKCTDTFKKSGDRNNSSQTFSSGFLNVKYNYVISSSMVLVRLDCGIRFVSQHSSAELLATNLAVCKKEENKTLSIKMSYRPSSIKSL